MDHIYKCPTTAQVNAQTGPSIMQSEGVKSRHHILIALRLPTLRTLRPVLRSTPPQKARPLTPGNLQITSQRPVIFIAGIGPLIATLFEHHLRIKQIG